MTVSINSGDLNRRILVEWRPTVQGSAGTLESNWEPKFRAWARIDQLSGRELIAAQAIHAETTHRVTLRYRPGVDASMRVVYRDRQFNVLAALDPETAHVALHLYCSEGLADNDRSEFRAIPA